MNPNNQYFGPQSALEQRYIEEYLMARGYHRSDLVDLPLDVARRLMTEASAYASLKLAELESKARFRQSIQQS